jgi:hypothetical protein
VDSDRKNRETAVTERAFILLDEPVPAPREPKLRPLEPAGRRQGRESVLISVEDRPHRRRGLVIVVLLLLATAAGVVLLRRRAAARQHPDDLARLEAGDDPIAMREPPIAAV